MAKDKTQENMGQMSPSINRGGMDFNKVKEVIDIDTKTGLAMASVVSSVYWGTPCKLKSINNFDADNYVIAISVMGYRFEKDWDNKKFWELARYAKAKLKLDKLHKARIRAKEKWYKENYPVWP